MENVENKQYDWDESSVKKIRDLLVLDLAVSFIEGLANIPLQGKLK